MRMTASAMYAQWLPTPPSPAHVPLGNGCAYSIGKSGVMMTTCVLSLELASDRTSQINKQDILHSPHGEHSPCE
jgi:hypothetical protein